MVGATSDFAEENLVGEGKFSKVYRGRLRGSKVAVKKLKRDADEEEFEQETLLAGRLRHQRLVQVGGFGVKGEGEGNSTGGARGVGRGLGCRNCRRMDSPLAQFGWDALKLA